MLFERPLAFLLLLAAPFVAWFLWRARGFFDTGGHRAVVITAGTLAFVALVTALAGPWAVAERGRPARIVVTGDADPSWATAWRDATCARDPFHLIAPGAPTVVGARGVTAPPMADGDPDLGEALEAAIALMPDGGDIVFGGTAGDSGHALASWNVHALSQRLDAAGIRVHARVAPLTRSEIALLAVRHACRVGIGEAFRVEAEIDTPTDTAARIEVRAADDDALLGARDLQLRVGTTFVAVDVAPGTRSGPLRLDTHVLVGGRRKSSERSAVLCDGAVTATWLGATDAQFTALHDTLAPFGIDVVRGDPQMLLDAPGAEHTDVVVVDDLPATAWSEAAQQDLATAIPQRGVGLLLSGAWRNLGPGGYSNSPLATLLPVEMPQREERRDPSCALVVVIDTSGSMGSRIDLAKEVARLAIRRLMPHDKAGIVEFYGSKRWAAPLQPASNLIELMRALDRMQAGGGTVIYSALEESYYALLNARTRFKHILVLTDGGVESGPFEELARRIADANMQLSTVLIGPQAQSDFLMDLAQWGGGRFYACPSRFQLPDLRFKEPQTTRLPTVREERITVDASAGRESTAALRDDSEVVLGGVVEASTKPAAERLVDADGGSSVLAAWDQGAGRVATLATELLGPLTDPVRGPRWSTFLADQVRSLARGRQATLPRLSIEASRSRARISLDGVDLGQPEVLQVISSTGMRDVTLQPDDSKSLSTTIAWPDDGVCQFQVADLDARGVAMRPAPRDGRLTDRADSLRALAGATGGTIDGPLPIEPPPPLRGGHRSLSPDFTIVGLVAFLLFVLARRWPRTATRSAGLLLGVVMLAPTAHAQDDSPIAARIESQIRDVGDLEPLAEEWRDGTPAQKLALAEARGDLNQVIALTAEAVDAETRVRRALAFDATGRLKDAIAALAAIEADASIDPAVRRSATLHRAELLAADDDRTAATDAFRSAARDATPELARAIGHLAGGLGLIDVALEFHTDDEQLPASARSYIHLRRGAWFEAKGDIASAQGEYRASAAIATMDRERAFALSRELGLARDPVSLRAFADSIRTHLTTATTTELETMLDALRACGDGNAVLALFDEPSVRSNAALQEEIVSIAVECGRAERAIEESERRLTAEPHDYRLRVSLALLLTDLVRKEAAHRVLMDGISIATHRELLALTQAAGELFDDDARDAGLARLQASETEAERTDGVMLDLELLRARHKDADAARIALAAREQLKERGSRARIAGVLESLGRSEEAVDMLRAINQEHASEDVALRLAWLLSQSKDEARRTESQKLFREVWLSAGSPARRMQAQERVLDAAARDGSLADLAIELEDAVARPRTPNRDACREALVKIWTRAQDTFGARDVLLQWAKEQPDHEIDAWQAIAQVCLETDDYRGQERALRHLMEIDPANSIEYRQQLVLAFLERGRAGDARAVIRELLAKEDEADAVTFEFSAGIYALAGKPRDAARLYRRAYAAHPDRIETLLLWANAMQSQQRGAEAIGVFLDLITKDVPDDLFLVAVDGLLNLAAPSESLRFAERALRTRIAANPDRVFLQRALQDVLEQLGDKAGRLAILEETVLIAGQQRSAWLREAMDEASQRKDWSRYLVHARCLLRTGEEVPPTVFVEMGEALLAANDLPGAERAFARARLAPDFAAIERRIATAYATARRFDDAERILRRALRRAPDDAEAMFAVAKLCEQRGARPEALDLWRRGALALMHGEVFASDNAPQRGFNRNRRTDGPDVDEALDGALRTAGSIEDVAIIRDTVIARLDGREALDANARRTLSARLRSFGDAFGDPLSSTRAREVEDGLLRDEKLDPRTRRELVSSAIRRFEVARLIDLPDKSFEGIPAERVRALLLAGDMARASERIDAMEPQTLDAPLRWLTAIGATELRDKAIARLREAAAEDPRKAGRAWMRAAPLIGEVADERRILAAELAEALAATGTARVRAGKLLATLRSNRSLSAEERAPHARKLVELAVETDDSNLAFSVLEAAHDWLPAPELAPLVAMSFKKLASPYLVVGRCKHVSLLPIDDAERLMRDTLRGFGDEGRMPLLQALANGSLRGELATRLLDLVGKGKFSPADSSWLTRLATSPQLEPRLLEAVARIMLRSAPDDPRRLLLDLRAAREPAARTDALTELTRSLLAMSTIDYTWTELADALVTTATPAERSTALAAIPSQDVSAAGLLLRGALEASLGRVRDAGDHVAAAALAAPENLSIQNQAVSLLALLGRSDQVARIYRAWLDRTAEVYAYQAVQLANALLDQGDALGAIEAIDRAKDDFDYTGAVRLRAALKLGDPQARARELAKWAQGQHRSRGPSIVFIRNIGGPGFARASVADTFSASSWPRFDTAGSPATSSEVELLGSIPEGRQILRDLLRKMDPSSRLSASEHYRGLLRAEREFGDAEAVLASARQRFDADPADADARGTLWAAMQLGVPLPSDLVDLLMQQRILLADQNQGELVELCWTALQLGRDTDVDRILRTILVDRVAVTSIADEPTGLGPILRLAARRAPDLLERLSPSDTLDVEVDSWLLAIATDSDETPSSVRARFAVVGSRLADPEAMYQSMRLALPWCGLDLREGDVDAAMRDLAVEDSSLERTDSFPAGILAAAVPSLLRWSAPEKASIFGERLADVAETDPRVERRFLYLRIAGLLAHRMDEAGQQEAAETLRKRLANAVDGMPAASAWLNGAK